LRLQQRWVDGFVLPSTVPICPPWTSAIPGIWNKLYRNNGDGTFADVTEKTGVQGMYFGMGVAAADYDNDGRVDLFVTGVNGCQLPHNNGDGTFTDVAATCGSSLESSFRVISANKANVLQ